MIISDVKQCVLAVVDIHPNNAIQRIGTRWALGVSVISFHLVDLSWLRHWLRVPIPDRCGYK
jgi:hypothetical protein